MQLKRNSLALLLIAGSLLFGCRQKEEPASAEQMSVTVQEVIPKDIPADFEYVGMAESSHLVEIFARVEGYLEKIAYVEGGFVKQGDLLFQLDPKPFEASLKSAEAELAKQQAVLWNAKRTKERLEPLFDQKAASRRDLDNSIADELSAEAQVDSAKAVVTENELKLGYTTITSPISGLSSNSKYREGTLISPGVNGFLTSVSVIDPIWVNFSVSESDLLKTRQEETKGEIVLPMTSNFVVEVILADNSIFPEKGKLDFANPSLDPKTGTMTVRAVFKNPDAVLRPGQFVRSRITGAYRPNAITLPQRAILQGKQGMFVYIVNKEGEVSSRIIEPGAWYNKDWIIKSGLKPGELVIIDGINKVRPGMKVKYEKLSEKQP